MFNAHPLAYFDLDDSTPDEIADLCAAIETDEDDVQIRLLVDGPWHRREVSRQRMTACGLVIRTGSAMGYPAGYNLRGHDYTGPLCPDCFTPYELGLSDAANQKEKP